MSHIGRSILIISFLSVIFIYEVDAATGYPSMYPLWISSSSSSFNLITIPGVQYKTGFLVSSSTTCSGSGTPQYVITNSIMNISSNIADGLYRVCVGTVGDFSSNLLLVSTISTSIINILAGTQVSIISSYSSSPNVLAALVPSGMSGKGAHQWSLSASSGYIIPTSAEFPAGLYNLYYSTANATNDKNFGDTGVILNLRSTNILTGLSVAPSIAFANVFNSFTLTGPVAGFNYMLVAPITSNPCGIDFQEYTFPSGVLSPYSSNFTVPTSQSSGLFNNSYSLCIAYNTSNIAEFYNSGAQINIIFSVPTFQTTTFVTSRTLQVMPSANTTFYGFSTQSDCSSAIRNYCKLSSNNTCDLSSLSIGSYYICTAPYIPVSDSDFASIPSVTLYILPPTIVVDINPKVVEVNTSTMISVAGDFLDSDYVALVDSIHTTCNLSVSILVGRNSSVSLPTPAGSYYAICFSRDQKSFVIISPTTLNVKVAAKKITQYLLEGSYLNASYYADTGATAILYSATNSSSQCYGAQEDWIQFSGNENRQLNTIATYHVCYGNSNISKDDLDFVRAENVSIIVVPKNMITSISPPAYIRGSLTSFTITGDVNGDDQISFTIPGAACNTSLSTPISINTLKNGIQKSTLATTTYQICLQKAGWLNNTFLPQNVTLDVIGLGASYLPTSSGISYLSINSSMNYGSFAFSNNVICSGAYQSNSVTINAGNLSITNTTQYSGLYYLCWSPLSSPAGDSDYILLNNTGRNFTVRFIGSNDYWPKAVSSLSDSVQLLSTSAQDGDLIAFTNSTSSCNPILQTFRFNGNVSSIQLGNFIYDRNTSEVYHICLGASSSVLPTDFTLQNSAYIFGVGIIAGAPYSAAVNVSFSFTLPSVLLGSMINLDLSPTCSTSSMNPIEVLNETLTATLEVPGNYNLCLGEQSRKRMSSDYDNLGHLASVDSGYYCAT